MQTWIRLLKSTPVVNEHGKHPGEAGYNYYENEKVNEIGKHPGEAGYNYVNEHGKHPGEAGYCYYINEAH